MNLPEVQDCRGLILRKDTWEVMCCSFRKFFNSAEGKAATIDWDTAIVMEKLDGSLIQLYFDDVKNQWFAATSGTGEGEGEVNNKLGTTFNDLFFETAGKYEGFDLTLLNKAYTYVFELTTPYNIVVKPHGVSSVSLLTMRNNSTLEEVTYDELVVKGKELSLPVVTKYDLNVTKVDDLLTILENVPWHDEGYVVMDAKFNRVKIKNPAYVAVHHLKSKTGEHHIMTIVKTNEVDEFVATFPDRKDEIERLKSNYDKLILELEDIWVELEKVKCVDESPSERKRFAEALFAVTNVKGHKQFNGLFFGLNNNKFESVKSYMLEYDDKILYKQL
jgi:hypothetical protein